MDPLNSLIYHVFIIKSLFMDFFFEILHFYVFTLKIKKEKNIFHFWDLLLIISAILNI